jgi:hypothetical protein
MKGGIGSASLTVGGVTVGALVAVNAVGDVDRPASGASSPARAAPTAATRVGAWRILRGEPIAACSPAPHDDSASSPPTHR